MNKLSLQAEVLREKDIVYSNAITGDDDNHLVRALRASFKKAKRIDMIVSFLMESGVKLIAEDLVDSVSRGTPIRILTGNYLNITQPQALYLLKDILQDSVDLRFYNVDKKSFHPKCYIFYYEEGAELYIGSSNLSNSALTNGVEWNYRLIREQNQEDFNYFTETFEELFNNHSIIVDDMELKRYSQNWVRPRVYKDFEKFADEAKDSRVINLYEPRDVQIDMLHELKKSREEGYEKGLLVAATGVGKTYVAAFDSRNFKKVLFVAHREEILKQAEQCFKNVRPFDSTGFFYGSYKNKGCDIIFSSVQTLGKTEYLDEAYFKREEFDYIVIDEFHHAAAGNYQNILDYFKPKFLLGLTATPERLDNKDVFSLCDYNLIYEIRLKDAINRGILCPFRYYGIYDDSINYANIEIRSGKYDERQLEEALMINNRVELIYKHYEKYNTARGLGFCSSRKHAKYMAEFFSSMGVKAAAVLSGEQGEFCKNREEAINELKSGELNVIFSVDMFNEGLDIPAVDMVMFLRPTESPTVFLQQLGRGLRRSKDKEYVNVLDFIGNYKNANLIPFFLSGKSINSAEKYSRKDQLKDEDFPQDCFIDFDFRLVDLFKRQSEALKGIKDRVIEEYNRIKEKLGHRPSRIEMFTYIDEDIYQNIRSRKGLNIFKNYLEFLKEIGELEETESAFMGTIAEAFINMIETTSMSKTYKMPVLLAFYNEGKIKLSIDEEDVYLSFQKYYSNNSNSIDLIKHKSTEGYRSWGKKEWYRLAKDNPLKFLSQTHGNFFTIHGHEFILREELREFLCNEAFIRNFKDAVDLRTKEYYKNRLEERQQHIREE